MAVRTTRHKATSPTAALLLLLQLLAGGAVPLAHAGERETAPATVEAHHDGRCVVIHDAMRCALCLYANSLTAPPPALKVGVRASDPARPAPLAVTMGMGSPTYVASQPRAPPLQLS
jgi:hypothetical protein